MCTLLQLGCGMRGYNACQYQHNCINYYVYTCTTQMVLASNLQTIIIKHSSKYN